jgi:hypothetical protein
MHKKRAALIVAHPGHELRVHGWLEQTQPLTLVLTKGDGAAGVPRLVSTANVLRAAGAPPGAIFGRLEDGEIYAAILRLDVQLLGGLLDELVDDLISHEIECVATDAEEGFNPSHDVCHYLARAASAISSRETGRPVAAFDFPLIGAPNVCPMDAREGAVRLRLDDAALERKLVAAWSYPELQHEVTAALNEHGHEAFRIECLRPLGRPGTGFAMPPLYEAYGERQVAAGRYAEVLRYAQHVLPVREWLESRIHGEASCAPAVVNSSE